MVQCAVMMTLLRTVTTWIRNTANDDTHYGGGWFILILVSPTCSCSLLPCGVESYVSQRVVGVFLKGRCLSPEPRTRCRTPRRLAGAVRQPIGGWIQIHFSSRKPEERAVFCLFVTKVFNFSLLEQTKTFEAITIDSETLEHFSLFFWHFIC